MSLVRRTFVGVIVALVVGGAAAGAQAGSAPAARLTPVDSANRWVDSIFAPYSSTSSPGCAVGVVRDGQLAFAKGYGMADLEHDTPITPSTRFYIASLSKQFTAMSIVLLAQEGRLSLDDWVRRWVPQVPSFGSPITLRQLLHHTSGLRDYFTLLALSGWPSDGLLTESQFIDLVSRQKSLNFTPGDEFLYSNTGYALLAMVVERASGQSLRDYAADHIFKPLGMTHTEFRDDHTQLIPHRAVGYQPTASGYRISQPELDVVGDGGVYSTIEDLAKWDANFESGRVGGRDGVAELEEPGRLNNGQAIPYALALTVGDMAGMSTFSHRGAYGGYRSAMLMIPSRRLSVISLCNTSGAPTTLVDQVATIHLGLIPRQRAVAAAAATRAIDFSAGPFSVGTASTAGDSTIARKRNDQLTQLAGEFYSPELDLAVSLVPREGILLLRRPHESDLRFVTFTTDLFTNNDQMLLRVVRNERGAVNGFTLSINRVRDLEFVKRPADRSVPFWQF
ncbi:MAG TPA: serine hydrolase domain-containing protein [Gemmatimonadaceae bacterium]|nr:serine hydrolase domain-containing protein [Gemmatimonadaceae bacterium]